MLTEDRSAPLILVVEDDDNHADLIQLSFADKPEEYRLERVSTLLAATTAIRRSAPDLILADYRMPDGNGSELVALAAGSCPVIMMTSHGSEQIAVEAMKIGAQDYIVKSPEAFEALPHTVALALQVWSLIQSRRQADKAVLRAKRDWEQTFDAVPDLISIIDTSHTITRVNRAMADSCGLKVGEMVGRKCHEIMHGLNAPHSCCPFERMLEEGEGQTAQIDEKILNGVFDITVSPLYNSEGKVSACVHVARDITGRKRAEEERTQLVQQLHQAQKLESLGVLAGGIAHDFNNILTVILGHCYMAIDDFIPEKEYKSAFRQIASAGSRAADLCRQMLTYAGKSPLVQTKILLSPLVDEVVKMLRAAIKKNVTIELDLKEDTLQIKGDSGQIQQIIMNLIINATEAIGEANGTISVVLKKTVVTPDQTATDTFGTLIHAGLYACLCVSDTGCGMDEETQKRIFEPFFSTKFTGRGLGMSAIHGIIKSHEAMLQLTSRPGIGTSFNIFFPLHEESDHVTRISAESVPSKKRSGTILIVEDEQALLLIGRVMLESMGFSTLTAENGEAALAIYRKRSDEIDLILLDLVMPVMGGIETYLELRKINRSLPIIICSGYGAESVEHITVDDPHAGFLHKPYKPSELKRVLESLVPDQENSAAGLAVADKSVIP